MVSMDDAELPDEWSRDERYDRLARRSGNDPKYVGYVHDSGDVRIHVAFPEAESGDRGTYTVFVTLFPYTELSESGEVRAVTTRDRSEEIAHEFMKLFDGVYDGPENIEEAIDYALQRTRPPDVADTSLINENGQR
ncbi:hypothetical protein ACFQL3_16110 [Natronoarchaeum sp. GCM10025321]|uniref:hypothetical protein n=1 Tax=Natronoarchaeum sp. GCM10025321 TaxID=3252684 RepID=UPI00361C0E8C